MFFKKDNIFMRIGLLCVILTFISIQMSFGQNSFHRLYPANIEDENIHLLDAIQLRSGNYVSIHQNIVPRPIGNPNIKGAIVITSYKPKGDILWSYEIADSLSTVFPFNGSIIQAENDSIYFNAGNLFGSIDMNGRLGEVLQKNVGNFVSTNNALLDYNKSIFNGSHTIASENISNIVISRLDYTNRAILSKKLVHEDSILNKKNANLHAMKLNQDSTLLLCGVVDSTHSFVAVVDTFGNVIWSRTYADEDTNKSIPTLTDGVMLSDSSFVLVGYVTEFFVTNAVRDRRGLILKLDKAGQIQWSKKVQFDAIDQTNLYNVIVSRSGDLLISGSNFDVSELDTYPFIISTNKDGNILWKNKFSLTNHIRGNIGNSLFDTQDGGAAMFHTAGKDNRDVTSFIKIDNAGKTTCELMIDEDILVVDTFQTDTLIWVSSVFALNDSIVSLKTKIHEYDVPVLELSVRPFCPNEPIDWTFSATTEGATNYKWSTGLEGPTADSLRVFEEGEYMVTVTIGEDVCYMLCDTVKLERYTEPAVSINLSLGNFCINGKQTLSIGYQPGHPQIKSIAWSTGETAGSIEIATPGNYSVTVIDQCDETATESIDVGPFPTKITAATISDQIIVNCLNGTISGVLSAQGNSTGLGPEKYLWSTGETTKTISINESNILTFTVTVTDICGTTATAIKVIELKGGGISDVNIQEDNSRKCTEGIVTLNAVTSVFSPNLVYNWSNGTTSGNLVTTMAGVYSVTVTDKCGNTATASRSIDFIGSPGFLSLAIIADSTRLCADSLIHLKVIPQISGNYTYKWSDNSTNDTLSIKQAGNYSVSVTDNCGNVQVVNYDYKFKKDKVEILLDREILCDSGKLILKTKISPDLGFNYPLEYKYKWSDGQTTDTIQIVVEGSYTVTVTDFCKNTATANIPIKDSNFDSEDLFMSVNIVANIRKDCSGIDVGFITNPDKMDDIKSIMWSSGEKTEIINYTGEKEYSVTITDICNNEYIAKANLGEANLPIDIAYANIFFPEGAEKRQRAATDTLSDAEKLAVLYNRTFGPVPLAIYCLDEITKYEFFVYNRWGQKVFESNRVADEWDGTHKDEKAPTETYVWVVKYTIFGIEKVKKGSVTLLRP
jgi:gliding motility-associated-like protein